MNEPRLPDAERLTALLRIVAVPVLIVGEAYVPSSAPTQGRFAVDVTAEFDVRAAHGDAVPHAGNHAIRKSSPACANWRSGMAGYMNAQAFWKIACAIRRAMSSSGASITA